MTLTDRYLGVVLSAVPRAQRPDVERELRSSIADALDDRLAAGEPPEAAEAAVLEGLGDPAALATRLSDRPTSLIGPELFPAWRQVTGSLLAVVVPLLAILLAVVAAANGEGLTEMVGAAIGGAFQALLQVVFWTTLVFAAVERFDTGRDAHQALGVPMGRWTVDRLPVPASARMGASDLVGELLSSIGCIIGLAVLTQVAPVIDGRQVPLLAPTMVSFWVPVLIVVLAVLAVFQVVVYMAGRWTMRRATIHALLQLAFSVPVLVLALEGRILDPAFGAAIRVPDLGAGDGWLMISIAVIVVAVTAWDILDAFRRARRAVV
ncbi:MAG: hypothetical protein KF809_18655 [Chloroflexi bacterium]|nr:hypothetical protein [Chloroflexota bacterium]